MIIEEVERRPTEVTDEIVKRTGLSFRLVRELQRKGVLPYLMKDATVDDADFITKLMKTWGNKTIVSAQLARLPLKVRKDIVENCSEYDLYKWERIAISRFLTLFRESDNPKLIKAEDVIVSLAHCKIKKTRAVLRRVKELRKIAWKKFLKEKKQAN